MPRQPQSRRPSARGRASSPRLAVEGLEKRVVLAAGIAFDRGGRTLSIVGSAGNDVAEVRQQGANVVVSLTSATGRVTRTMPAAQVSRVVFAGLAGNDSFTNQTAITARADGGAGADVLRGGRGVDELIGGDGNDRLVGNAGNDVIDGGAGDDAAWGSAGDDRLMGGAGQDQVYGEDGADGIWGGAGNDELRGGSGDDSLQAEAGDDMLDGEAGRDQLVGGDGLDREVDPQDRFSDGDDDGDGYDNDYAFLDILYESPGTESAYADDVAAAPIIASVTAGVRSLLHLPADDAGLRVRVARERFGTLVTGTWRYLTPDRIQVWGRWVYPEADPARLNAFAQYRYTGPYSGNPADYTNPANYTISEELRIYANSARGPLTFVSWLPGTAASFYFSALDPRAVDPLRAALGSMPNFTNVGDSFAGDFSTAPGLPGVRPVVDLVRTVNQVSRTAITQPPPVRPAPAA